MRCHKRDSAASAPVAALFARVEDPGVAVPLTLIGMQRAWLRGVVLGVAGVVYTIPSLALFVLITPYFGIFSNAPIG